MFQFNSVVVKINSMSAVEAKSKSPANCLTRSVVDVLANEPTLEAVTIHRAAQKISVATLGQTDVPRLTRQLTERLHFTQAADADAACGLLKGDGDCAHCAAPLTPAELRGITIAQDATAITIARVTCPTAPKFWRWRDIPFPKIAPREMEIHDDDHHIDE